MRAAVYLLLLCPLPAGAEPPTAHDVRADLGTVQQQLNTEAQLMEALTAFPRLTLEEFTALPAEDVARDRFVWAWAEHYRRARLGDTTLAEIPPEPDAARREALTAFDPSVLRAGMQTEGASRMTDADLPAVLRPCADAHEAVHERDLHAEARRFAREHAETLLASGALLDDPGYVQLEARAGRAAALKAFADELFARDLAANRQQATQRSTKAGSGPVRMLDGPLRDANVYYGHVDPRQPAGENFARVKRLAAFERRAYEASTRCLEAVAGRLRTELAPADEGE